MHQPDIDGERPLTKQNQAESRILAWYLNQLEITLEPYDSAVKHNFEDIRLFCAPHHNVSPTILRGLSSNDYVTGQQVVSGVLIRFFQPNE